MAFQSITTGTYTVHPSANDVASTTGDGSYLKETLITDLLEQVSGGGSWIVSGFDYASASGLTATFNAGTAIINGYLVSRVGTFDVTLEDDVTNHVWLTFSVDGSNNVTAWGLEINSTNTVPTGVPGYVKLATITTVSGAVTASTDERTTTHPLDQSSIATTKGDLLVRSSSELTRLPIGSNNQILTADSAEGNGMKWADAAGGGGAMWMVPFGFNTSGKYYDQLLDQGYIASANLRKYSQLDTTSGDGESSIMQCAIPSSATSIDSVTLYLSANSTTEPTIDIYCAMRGEGETYNQGTFSNLTGQSAWYTQGSTNLLEYVDISAQFSSAAGGDQIAIGVKRAGGSNQCYVIGCLLEYS